MTKICCVLDFFVRAATQIWNDTVSHTGGTKMDIIQGCSMVASW